MPATPRTPIRAAAPRSNRRGAAAAADAVEQTASREALQARNDELTALNGQLQDTLRHQRTTFDDLQDVLYSTDVATLFLDCDLNIRLFTPAIRSLFGLIPGDIGRNLADLHQVSADDGLPEDARAVLSSGAPIEREIEAGNGHWYVRRVLPYRTHAKVGGVVITFRDITERRHIAEALQQAKLQAEFATAAKSRFLAAASHDLRQPLQTLSLMRGVLAQRIRERKYDEALVLVARLEETAAAMTGMLNALLDINQIEAGTVRPEVALFRMNDLLDRLRDEFTYHAEAQGLVLRVMPCGLLVRSDPRLLEQMLRNLLANALKFTRRGKVLLGCRHRAGTLSVEVWDTGVGIPAGELDAVFEEFHQADNAARERGKGLGLGLSIVRRLAGLLGHRIWARSQLGRGSVFAIDIVLPATEAAQQRQRRRRSLDAGAADVARRTGAILVVEDDPEACELLALLLNAEGHRAATAPDGAAALLMTEGDGFRPDIVLADYNLPGGMDGLALIATLRERLGAGLPAIILTGDISTQTLRNIAGCNCTHLNKPARFDELGQIIQRLLAASLPPLGARSAADLPAPDHATAPVIFVVDDDSHLRDQMRSLLEADGRTVRTFASCEAFLDDYDPAREACLLIDAYLPGMDGLALLRRLNEDGNRLPAIMITGNSDVKMAVQAMKAGATDFIEKPVAPAELRASIAHALEQRQDSRALLAWRRQAADQVAALTARQQEVMALVLAGHPSKNIATDLGISQRTVENHRASIMAKTGSKSLPALARLGALAAAWTGAEPPTEPDTRSVEHAPRPDQR